MSTPRAEYIIISTTVTTDTASLRQHTSLRHEKKQSATSQETLSTRTQDSSENTQEMAEQLKRLQQQTYKITYATHLQPLLQSVSQFFPHARVTNFHSGHRPRHQRNNNNNCNKHLRRHTHKSIRQQFFLARNSHIKQIILTHTSRPVSSQCIIERLSSHS